MPKKAQKKKQEKVIEDRTFGLKNKNKSKTVQKFIKGVEQTVRHQGMSAARMESDEYERKKNKKKEQEQKALLNALYKDVGKLNEESEEEEDPKNIVCPYFKQGLCQKGKKCIYSHDLTLDRNEEIDLYVDQRTQLIMNKIGSNVLNSMSEQEVSKVIAEKEKEYFKGEKSDIVCKNFLDAVEKSKYGWNWTCQNGDGCKYKHCLPPGYILNKDGGNAKIQVQEVNIEEKIDEQRNKLVSENKGSPLVTFEVFMKWKEEKIKRKAREADKKKKQEEKKSKKQGHLRTGRELFTYDPTLFIDDEEAAQDYDDREQEVENNKQKQKQEEGMEKVEEKDEQREQEEAEGDQEQQQKILEGKPEQDEEN